MVCDGVLHSHRILKTVKMSVTNNKLTVLSNKFSKQKFMFYKFCDKILCYVLIFYGYVGHHHMGLAISLQVNYYI